MKVVFVGVRKEREEEITSGPLKIGNILYNRLSKKYDDFYFYGLSYEEKSEDADKVHIINDKEVIGPLNKLKRFVKKNNIEVLYIARYYSALALYAVFLKIVMKIKLVYTVHGLVIKEKDINKSFKNYSVLCEKLLLKNCDKIVAISHALKDEILQYYPWIDENKIEVINNGVSEIFISKKLDIRKIYGLEISKNILFTVGIRKIKNIELLLESFVNNTELYTSSYLLVAGETDTEYAKVIIDKYKNYDNIKFIGYVDTNEMNNIYEQMDLFIQVSKFETFGMSIVESLLHKKQVLISSNLPISEYFKEGEINLYNGNTEDLALCIQKSLKLKDCTNEQGYRKVKSQFHWDSICEKYYNVFRETAQKH